MMHPHNTTSHEQPSKRLYQVQLENREFIYNFEIATNNYDAVEIAQECATTLPEQFTPRSPLFLTCYAHVGDYSEEECDAKAARGHEWVRVQDKATVEKTYTCVLTTRTSKINF